MQDNHKQISHRTKELLTGLPETCGVYIFRSATGMIIYIGKTVNLKRRVRQYFSRANHAPEERKDALAKYIAHVEWIPCQTELHALILEDELIKTHRPLYNRKLKKCLSYAYIGMPTAPYAELVLLRPVEAEAFKATGEVFGPFQDEFVGLRILDLLCKYFLLRSCTGRLPATACMRKELRCCLAPCSEIVPERTYQVALRKARRFLAGEGTHLLDTMAKHMLKLGREGDYEQAAHVRDQLVFAKSLFLKNRFYRKFRDGHFLLYSEGRWPGTFLFSKGELIFYSQDLVAEGLCRDRLPALPKTVPLPDRVLYDRALIVAAWSRGGDEDRRYGFLEPENFSKR